MKKSIFILIALCTCFMLAGCGDTTAPTIEGVEDTVQIQCGTDFNLTDYVSQNIKVKDDSGEEPALTIKCDKNVYDKKTGKINTSKYGEFQVMLTATDSAENSTNAKFTLKLNPIHVTKDNKHPVIYDGKYGKITFNDASHGNIEGTDQYFFTLDVENNSDTSVSVYFGSSSTTINKYQTGAYYTIAPIGSGNRGKAEISIYDEDIPDDVGTIKEIITAVGMCEYISDDEDGDEYLRVPMIIDVNVID